MNRVPWTAWGFQVGRVARVRGRPDLEGRITGVLPTRGLDEEPLVQLQTWSGCKAFLSLPACEVRGVDYAAPRRPRRRAREASHG